MKPGKYDKKLEILITGLELQELKKWTDDLPEYPHKDSPEHLAIKALHNRLKKEYKRLWRK